MYEYMLKHSSWIVRITFTAYTKCNTSSYEILGGVQHVTVTRKRTISFIHRVVRQQAKVWQVLGRITCTQWTGVTRSIVYVSICVLGTQVGCANKQLDQSRCCLGELACVGQRNLVVDGGQDLPTGMACARHPA